MRVFLWISLAAASALAQPSSDSWRSAGVIDVGHTPHVKLHSVPIRAVKMSDGFWSARMRINV